MSKPILLSIVESRGHPDFTDLYEQLGFEHQWVTSMRKALSFVKKTAPDYVVAEFFYGYGNNYAGVNISNLDVFLYSLEKYAPQARVIALVSKAERQHAERLNEIIAYHGIAQYPVRESDMRTLLTS
ncbi:MAG: hypothetical protein OQL16_12710 [Gammaproteobacteria bacterium]|nr:hypothetical protein [Gammaproteobacteria bacterium]